MKIRLSEVEKTKDGKTLMFSMGVCDLAPEHTIYVRNMRVNEKGHLLAPGVRVGRGYLNQVLFSGPMAEELTGKLRRDSVLASALHATTPWVPCEFGEKSERSFFGDPEAVKLKMQIEEQDTVIHELRKRMADAGLPPWEEK